MTLTTVNPALLDTQAQYTGFKNRIINGAMAIDQRNAGASVTPTASTYTLDRWRVGASVASKVSVQQSTVAPEGFKNSVLVTSLSAYTITGTEEVNFGQRIEGFNTADFGWGTSNAKTVTFSFLVRSSLTGLFSGAVKNFDSSRSYVFSYTISAANTWEQKTITIAGDTTGTWKTDNDTGVVVQFCIASASNLNTAGAWYGVNTVGVTGTTQLVATNGATWQITGVQLEKGSTATSFDYRPYGTELQLCQRYFEVLYSSSANNYGVISCSGVITGWAVWDFKVEKRALPTGALGSTASWTISTPTTYLSTSGLWYGAGGTSFYSSTTGASQIAHTASAEL